MLRGAALMPAAALAVHQLRYRLAFGAQAPRELAAEGHAYLATLAPWIALVAALAVGAALGRLARRWAAPDAGRPGREARGALRVWLVAATALLVVYAAQELLEGALAAGHRGGLAGVLGAGGWWALPLALAAGGLLALALCAERAAERALAARRPPLRLAPPPARGGEPAPAAPAAAPRRPLPAPLARAAAGRAPPPFAVAT